MAFTSYKVDNDRAFQNAIDRYAQNFGSLKKPFGLISRDFYRSQQAIFNLKSAGQYPDLNPRYKQRKIKKYGFAYPILKATGKLADSVLGPNAEGSVNEIGDKFLVIGTTIYYGEFHQSDEPRTTLPQRKFLFIGPEAPKFANSDQKGRVERWLNIINDFALKQARRQGFDVGKI